jgi:hypothetical protein
MLAWADHEWKTEAFSRSALVNVERSFAMFVLCSIETVMHCPRDVLAKVRNDGDP